MSGGSYDYLYAADYKGITLDALPEEQMQRMAERLAGLGYADDAAAETLALLLYLRQVRVFVDVRWERLREVWKSVEWWDSADSGEESVKDALSKYWDGGR
jgi:hypothetical protein